MNWEYLLTRKNSRPKKGKFHHARCSFSVIHLGLLKINQYVHFMAEVHFHFSMLSLVCLRIGMLLISFRGGVTSRVSGEDD